MRGDPVTTSTEATEPEVAPETRRPIPERRVPFAVFAGVVALAAMLVLAFLGGGIPEPAPEGLPDPGRVTVVALPVLGLFVQLSGVLVIGALLVAVLAMTRTTDELTASGFRAIRSARWVAVAWVGFGLAEVWFTVSDQLALPPSQVDVGTAFSYAFQIPQGRSALAQVALVAIVAVAAHWVLAVREALVVLGLALLALVPPILTGHAASSGSHDMAVVALLFHVIPVAVWVGGVVALWGHLRIPGGARLRAVRRFSSLAPWCFGIVAVSGVVSALVRVDTLTELFTTGYGAGVLAKTAVLALLGLVAYRVRGWLASATPETGSGWRTFVSLTGVELVLMATAIGLGTALSRTPPPVGEPYTELAASLLGGPMPPAPTIGEVLWSFRASGVGLAVVLLGAAAYAVGVWSLRRRGEHWSLGRSVAWGIGLLVFGYATIGGLGVYSHVMFSAHMGAHMVLSMIAPIFLVLGAPINLALRALPGADRPGGQGPRQLLAAMLRTRVAGFFAHPAVAAIIFVGSLYAVYYTPIFDALMTNHLGHGFMELHFLITGYLFYETLLGSAPVPRRLPHLGRLLLLLVVAPFHAFFSIGLMSTSRIVGGEYYRMLDRPFAADLAQDQYVGGSLSWALGEVPILIVALAMLVQWFRKDRRESARFDRREDASGDAELEAYNEMLRRRATEVSRQD